MKSHYAYRFINDSKGNSKLWSLSTDMLWLMLLRRTKPFVRSPAAEH